MTDLWISIGIALFCGMLNGNMDALAHHRQEIIWNRWDNFFTRWMLRSVSARESIPRIFAWQPVRGLFEAVWDGWHGSKSLMFVLLIAVLPWFFIPIWWVAVVLVVSFQIGFFVSYHGFLTGHA